MCRPTVPSHGANGGTGLGLAISSELVRLMGGEIRVQSVLEQGSSFIFTLPCDELPSEKNEYSDVCLRGLQALTVDGNSVNSAILTEMLEGLGMLPVSAASEEQAIHFARTAAAENDPFAFVLLDTHLPGSDGFIVAERILQERGSAKNVVMMLSPANLHTDAVRSRLLGLEHYLVKPVCESDLRTLLLEALGVTKARANLIVAPEKSGTPLHVLVAEDNPVNRKLVSRLLEKQGHTVACAHDGFEAVDSVKRDRFDLILMDIQMPRMGGFEATARIRGLELADGKTRTPIIALTAHAMKGDRERCLEGDMDGYLSKPLRTEELQAALEKWAPRSAVQVVDAFRSREA